MGLEPYFLDETNLRKKSPRVGTTRKPGPGQESGETEGGRLLLRERYERYETGV